MNGILQLIQDAIGHAHSDGVAGLTLESYHANQAKCKLVDAVRALLAERDKLAKDAERYRWLRDPCSGAERVIFYCRGDYGRGLMSSTMLDAAIDEAMEKEEGK